jgi:hypothetical protein
MFAISSSRGAVEDLFSSGSSNVSPLLTTSDMSEDDNRLSSLTNAFQQGQRVVQQPGMNILWSQEPSGYLGRSIAESTNTGMIQPTSFLGSNDMRLNAMMPNSRSMEVFSAINHSGNMGMPNASALSHTSHQLQQLLEQQQLMMGQQSQNMQHQQQLQQLSINPSLQNNNMMNSLNIAPAQYRSEMLSNPMNQSTSLLSQNDFMMQNNQFAHLQQQQQQHPSLNINLQQLQQQQQLNMNQHSHLFPRGMSDSSMPDIGGVEFNSMSSFNDSTSTPSSFSSSFQSLQQQHQLQQQQQSSTTSPSLISNTTHMATAPVLSNSRSPMSETRKRQLLLSHHSSPSSSITHQLQHRLPSENCSSHNAMSNNNKNNNDDSNAMLRTDSVGSIDRSSRGENSSVCSTSMDSEALLHNSCKLYPKTMAVVESALRFDPDAIRRCIPVTCYGPDEDKESGDTKEQGKDKNIFKSKRPTPTRYSYPINIAMHYQADEQVLELLIRAGPDVLTLPDGPDKASALAIALTLGCSAQVIEWMVTLNPACARLCDRHSNLPLHTAMRAQKMTLSMVQRIREVYPEALTRKNFHGETPLEVAVRCTYCPEEVVDYLQRISFEPLEAEASHLNDEFEGYVEI